MNNAGLLISGTQISILEKQNKTKKKQKDKRLSEISQQDHFLLVDFKHKIYVGDHCNINQ